MPFPSVSYTLVNGTANDAGPVNTNFTDLIAGLSDGTKDINVATIDGTVLDIAGAASLGGLDITQAGVATGTSLAAFANSVAGGRTRTTGTTVAAGGVAISDSTTLFTSTSLSLADLTGAVVTITTTGRPVVVALQYTDILGYFGISKSGSGSVSALSCDVYIYRDASAVMGTTLEIGFVASTSTAYKTYYSTPLFFVDTPSADTYTYSIKFQCTAGTLFSSRFTKLVAFEL